VGRITYLIRTYDANELTDADWDAFQALRAGQPAYDNPFFDPDFARLMAKVRDDTSVAVSEDLDGLLAYWPMHIGLGRWARAIGGPFSDRNGPIVRKGSHVDVAEFLKVHKVAGLTTVGLVVCDQFKADKLEITDASITELETDWETFLAAQTKEHPSYFKKMRRLRRKLEKEHADVVFTFDDQRPESYEQLIRLKREQYARTNKHDVLGVAWSQKMLEALRAGECPNLRTRLSTIYAGNQMVAAEFNLQSGNLLHGWLVCYDPAFYKYSPGNLLTMQILENMSAHGMTRYDAGTGSDHYKKYYANVSEPIANGSIRVDDAGINPIRMLGDGWGLVESVAPERLSEILVSMRRRADQIVSTETSLDQQMLGFAKAVIPSRFKVVK